LSSIIQLEFKDSMFMKSLKHYKKFFEEVKLSHLNWY